MLSYSLLDKSYSVIGRLYLGIIKYANDFVVWKWNVRLAIIINTGLFSSARQDNKTEKWFHDITPFFDLDKILWQYYEKLFGLWFIMYKVQINLMRRLFLEINDKRRDMEKLAEILQALKSR